VGPQLGPTSGPYALLDYFLPPPPLTGLYQNDTNRHVSNVTPLRRPINWDKLRSDEAERVIRERALPDGTRNVIFRDHAWERVSEREITREDVFDILRTGFCGEPYLNEKGDWQVIVTKRIKGNREAGAVTIVLQEGDKLIIRTVEWMDLR
jgi:Domain of unknown function (DUF4258)